jgi:N-methylhydantoinase B
MYDPITLKVIWDRLIAICQDAAATMVRTTFSPIVREGNDYSCSLIDARGRQLGEPPHTIPSFTGTLPFTVRHFLERFPVSELKPGDSIVTNDSWLGTGHLNDFNIATPVFGRSGRVVAIASCTAHMTDIGGAINFGANREIQEEGLRLPISKIVRGGRINDDLVELIRFNVRLPDECIGDLTGMLAANRTMGQRLLELAEEQHIENFDALADEIYARSEEAMHSAILELPPGQYKGSVTFDSVGSVVTITATVTIADGEVTVDYTGTSAQDRHSSVNVVMNYTYAYTVYPLKFLIHPRLPNNDGCLRSFRVTAPLGSILNCQWPAAGFSRNFVGHMIHAAIFSAFEQIAPDRIWGHSGSAPSGLECLMGTHSDGRPLVHLFFGAGGGTGAMPTKDGECCYFPTNIRATSIESTESLAPVVFTEKSMICDSAGPGRYRGGLGTRLTVRNIGNAPILYSGQVGRLHYPALGLVGGLPGQPNHLYLNYSPIDRGWGRWDLNPGDTFTKESPGGGGLHSPFLREPQEVLEDVIDGLVSVDGAREDYGVVIGDNTVLSVTDKRTSFIHERVGNDSHSAVRAGTDLQPI